MNPAKMPECRFSKLDPKKYCTRVYFGLLPGRNRRWYVVSPVVRLMRIMPEAFRGAVCLFKKCIRFIDFVKNQERIESRWNKRFGNRKLKLSLSGKTFV